MRAGLRHVVGTIAAGTLMIGCGGASSDNASAGATTAAVPAASGQGVGTTQSTAGGRDAASATSPFPGVGGATYLAVDGDDIWMPDGESGRLVRIDATTGHVVATIAVGPVVPPHGNGDVVSAGSLGVWVAKTDTRSLALVDTTANRLSRTIDIGLVATAVTQGDGSLWVAAFDDDRVVRIDPSTGKVLTTITTPFGPENVVAGMGAVWVALEGQTLLRVDPSSDRVVATITFDVNGARPRAIAVDETGVWVGLEEGKAVARIDPVSNTVAETIKMPGQVVSIATGMGSVWASLGGAQRAVVRIDEATGTVLAAEHPSHQPTGIAVADGAVWTDNVDATYSRFGVQ
jgi:streptogramin lyase